MSINGKTVDKCSGCSACKSICPEKCIKMLPNSEGFLYPEVDETMCIECAACEKICPVLNMHKPKEKPICYAAVNKNNDIQMNSSSGGIFYLLAEGIINDGGVVYGAAVTDDIKVKHLRADSIDDVYRLMGSKYVQSDLGNSFQLVKNDLLEGKNVLFSGTPCQVIGLKSFLNKDYTNLLTVDVICHGVPSQKLLDKYISYIEKKHHRKVEAINFRCKSVDFFKGKTVYHSENTDLYMRMFLNDICMRQSCYDCYAKNNNASDITLGDFWGIENVNPDMADDNGTSLVIVRNENGKQVFNSISNKIKFAEVDYESAVKENSAEYESVVMPEQRTDFIEDLKELTFQELSDKYIPNPKSIKGKIYNRIADSRFLKILPNQKKFIIEIKLN